MWTDKRKTPIEFGSRPLFTLSLWMVFGGLALAYSIWVSIMLGNPDYAKLMVPLSLGVILTPVGVRIGFLQVVNWHYTATDFIDAKSKNLNEWIEAEFSDFQRARLPLIIGLVASLGAPVAFLLGGSMTGLSMWIGFGSWIVIVVSAFCSGVGIGAMFILARFVWRLGKKYSFKKIPSGFGVSPFGRTILKVYLIACGIWFIYTLSAAGAPSQPLVPLLVLAAPAVVLLLGTFVFCQLPAHERLMQSKRARINEIDELILRYSPGPEVELTSETIKKLEFLQQMKDRVSDYPEWPVGKLGSLTAVGGSIWAVSPSIWEAYSEYVLRMAS